MSFRGKQHNRPLNKIERIKQQMSGIHPMLFDKSDL